MVQGPKVLSYPSWAGEWKSFLWMREKVTFYSPTNFSLSSL